MSQNPENVKLGISLEEYWKNACITPPAWSVKRLSYFDLKINDIVTYSSMSQDNGMILYRIDKDFQPRTDATYGVYRKQIPIYRRNRRGNSEQREGWCYPNRATRIPTVRLNGCIELKPVLHLLPGGKMKRRTVRYSSISRQIKKVDILELARSFSDFQSFIQQESKRLSGEAV